MKSSYNNKPPRRPESPSPKVTAKKQNQPNTSNSKFQKTPKGGSQNLPSKDEKEDYDSPQLKRRELENEGIVQGGEDTFLETKYESEDEEDEDDVEFVTYSTADKEKVQQRIVEWLKGQDPSEWPTTLQEFKEGVTPFCDVVNTVDKKAIVLFLFAKQLISLVTEETGEETIEQENVIFPQQTESPNLKQRKNLTTKSQNQASNKNKQKNEEKEQSEEEEEEANELAIRKIIEGKAENEQEIEKQRIEWNLNPKHLKRIEKELLMVTNDYVIAASRVVALIRSTLQHIKNNNNNKNKNKNNNKKDKSINFSDTRERLKAKVEGKAANKSKQKGDGELELPTTIGGLYDLLHQNNVCLVHHAINPTDLLEDLEAEDYVERGAGGELTFKPHKVLARGTKSWTKQLIIVLVLVFLFAPSFLPYFEALWS